MQEFINAFNHNVVAYGDTGERWSKLQLLAKIKRAMAGKWDYALHAFLQGQDPDLKALKTNLLAEAQTKAEEEQASTLKSAFTALTLQPKIKSLEGCRNVSKGNCKWSENECKYSHSAAPPVQRLL